MDQGISPERDPKWDSGSNAQATRDAIVLFFLAVGLFAAPALVQAGSFTGLGQFVGGYLPIPSGVSADGAVVVGYVSSDGGTEAFRWTSGGGMVGLGDLPGGAFNSDARGVSADGSVVVGNGTSTGVTEAFRWTSGGGMVGLGGLVADEFHSAAFGVSADGTVVVGSGNSVNTPGAEAFRWTSGGGMVGLGDLPGGFFFSEATAVSVDGAVVVGYASSADFHDEAFRWTSGGGMVGLGDLPDGAIQSVATGVSAHGAVVVGYGNSDRGQEAFRWTSGGGMVGLGDLPDGAFSSEARGVSGDGKTVIGSGGPGGGQKAFIWDPIHGMRYLQTVLETEEGLAATLAGWTLFGATAISEDGTWIVGYGLNPDGLPEAWRAQIGPVSLPPVCSAAQAFPSLLWSPNLHFVPVVVMGVTDPDGDAVTITVTGVTQDEPVKGLGSGTTSPDAVLQDGSASVRAERNGNGNGRVYQVSFKADDGKGGVCTGAVTVSVPHSLHVGFTAIDDGQIYDSTVR